MLPRRAILLNGVLQGANREIGGPRKINKVTASQNDSAGKKPGKQPLGCARDDRLAVEQPASW